jgi:CRP/FNR family cyclic AMP-dependent transcriptional regulator
MALSEHHDERGSLFAAVGDDRLERPVRLFEHDPDLLRAVEPRLAAVARQHVVADSLVLAAGPWTPPTGPAVAGDQALGLLVLEGLLTRTLSFDELRSPELIGVGDLLRPWESDASMSLEIATQWHVLERATVAVLDARVARQVGRIPGVTAALLGRSVQRSHWLAFMATVAHVRRADARVLMLFWYLADRWGRVTPRGIHVPLRLTHSLIASLISMRRPTVSTALTQLARADRLWREPDGSWLLTGEPPATTRITRRAR